MKLPSSPPDAKLFYGKKEQFGEFRIPPGKGLFPVIVIIHGGCWLSKFADLSLMSPLATALTNQFQVATWNKNIKPLINREVDGNRSLLNQWFSQ